RPGRGWPACLVPNAARCTLHAALLYPALLLEEEHALLVGDHEVRPAVAVDVGDGEMSSYAGGAGDPVARPFPPPPVLPELVPVEDSGVIRADVAVRAVRPPALSRHDVRTAVAVEVGHRQRVRLGEAVVDHVAGELRPVRPPSLLEPPDADVVRRAGDHV